MKKRILFIILSLCTFCIFLCIFLYFENELNMEISEAPISCVTNQENNGQEQQDIIESNLINSDTVDDNHEYQGWLLAQKYLEQEIPELKAMASYIEDKSEGKTFLIIDTDIDLKKVYKNENRNELLGNYYMIYVGERWEDHRANWEWFYVSEDINEILWCEIVEDEVYSLEEWRNSSKYKNQLKEIPEMQKLE